MKKVISLLLTVILLLCSFSFIVPAYAADFTKADLDLSQYTMDDLMNMSAEEYRALLRDFERVYDPFGTYDTDPIMKDVEATSEPEIMPVWGSGKPEKDKTGSHEMIAAQALNVLANDKGIFSSDALQVIVICLTISLAAIKPDTDERGSFPFYFEGHFYHAYDGDSYTGSTTNTALTNCRKHFNQAVSAAKSGNDDMAYMEIGMALHYIQDAGEPHHAANITGANVAHTSFENYIDKRIDTYVNLRTTLSGFLSNYSYSTVQSNSVDYYVKGISKIAYGYRDQVNNALNQTKWDNVARMTVPNAIAFSAVLLYKFASVSGKTLY